MRFWTACRETGDKIEFFDSYENAERAIILYETLDKMGGCYTEEFYSIVNDDYCIVDENGNEIR